VTYEKLKELQMSYSDQRILVLGCGVSGRSLAQVCIERGVDLHILDAKKKEELLSGSETSGSETSASETSGSETADHAVPEEWFDSSRITFWLNGKYPTPHIRFDEVLVSPGVPLNHPIVNHYRDQGSKIFGELEWALLQVPGRIVIITGSNGKTTTALLLYHLLASMGNNAHLVGNIGTPVSSLLCKNRAAASSEDILVVEASSYQLEASFQFVPEVAMLLNISENHLERHGTLDDYINAKLKPFRRMNQGAAQVVTSNELEGLVRERLKDVHPCVSVFGSKEIGSLPISPMSEKFFSWVDTRSRDAVVLYSRTEILQISLADTALIGEHNRRNCAAALLALKALGVSFDKASLEGALQSFRMPSYRIQECGVYDGIKWINDSKSTTPEASRIAIISSLECYPESSLTLLLGGQMKNASWEGVWSLIAENIDRISRVIFFGRSGTPLLEQLTKYQLSRDIETTETPTLREAIRLARKQVVSGEVVLFSPGCASFDEFRNFEDRGAFFDREIII